MNQVLKNHINQALSRFGYQMTRIPKIETNPQILGNYSEGVFIICNFCGTLFRRTSGFHSESLECPFCGAIARERVIYQCILYELNRRFSKPLLFFIQTGELKNLRMLECSPRFNDHRKAILHDTMLQYISTDFDRSGHPADIQLDLTDFHDIEPYQNSLDIIICPHVLEHILEYNKALKNLNLMLAPAGILILQVPILQNGYSIASETEFHADNTRVFHHFGFDLLFDLDKAFTNVKVVVGTLDFQITSPEIQPDKYEILLNHRERCIVLGEQQIKLFGLGIPDLCEAFIANKK